MLNGLADCNCPSSNYSSMQVKTFAVRRFRLELQLSYVCHRLGKTLNQKSAQMNVKRKGNRWQKKKKSTCRSFLSRPLHLWPFHSLCQSLPKKTNATMTAGQGKCWSPPPQYAIASHFKVLALDTLFDALGPCLVASKTMWLWHSRRLFCKKIFSCGNVGGGGSQKGKNSSFILWTEEIKTKLVF